MIAIYFTVVGVPQPQGSIRAFMPKGAKFPSLTSDNAKLKPWRQDIAQTAILEMKGNAPSNEAISIIGRFYFSRPKSRKNSAHKTTKPDIDKLARGLMDALTGIVFRDDSQVVECLLYKSYGSPERVDVGVQELRVL